MKKNITYTIEPSDIKLIKKVMNNPCASCYMEPAWCCGCHKEKKYKETVYSIPEENREYILELASKYSEYIETEKTIDKLQSKLEKIKNEYNIDILLNDK